MKNCILQHVSKALQMLNLHVCGANSLNRVRQDTLNLLRKLRKNPRLSAYAILNGQFDFNGTPLAPVGTKALVFLDPKHRKTFQTKL
jgi:hypothetical protein